MKIVSVNKTLKFKQSGWLKKNIDFKTDKKNYVNSFEKGFFKLMNNSVYDKTLEHLARLVNNTKVIKVIR